MNYKILKVSLFILSLNWNNFVLTDDFQNWLKKIKLEASTLGITDETIIKSFSTVKIPNKKVLKLYNNQPEFKISFNKYYSRNINNKRIQNGKKLLSEHKKILNEVYKVYSIPQEIIIAIWGIETNYGKYIGNFNTIEALTTLAYASKRKGFFKKELFNSLLIIEKGYIKNDKTLIGSWAGAMGQSQFMPSSYINYAVDFNKDSKIDLWNTYQDIFASIANYLKMHGWNKNRKWSMEIFINSNFKNKVSSNSNYTISDLAKFVKNKETLGEFDVNKKVKLKIVNKDNTERYFIIFENFDIIKKYNNSDFYALVIGDLANQIRN